MWSIKTIESEFEEKRFHHDSIYRFGVVKYLEIVGEASNHLSDDLKKQYPDIAWRDIIDFRNFASHQYFDLNWDLILDIIQQDLPNRKNNSK